VCPLCCCTLQLLAGLSVLTASCFAYIGVLVLLLGHVLPCAVAVHRSSQQLSFFCSGLLLLYEPDGQPPLPQQKTKKNKYMYIYIYTYILALSYLIQSCLYIIYASSRVPGSTLEFSSGYTAADRPQLIPLERGVLCRPEREQHSPS